VKSAYKNAPTLKTIAKLQTIACWGGIALSVNKDCMQRSSGAWSGNVVDNLEVTPHFSHHLYNGISFP